MNGTLSWLKGNHALTFGGTFTRSNTWSTSQTAVPAISFDVDTSDPANAMFTAANLPGAAATDLANARSLYARRHARHPDRASRGATRTRHISATFHSLPLAIRAPPFVLRWLRSLW